MKGNTMTDKTEAPKLTKSEAFVKWATLKMYDLGTAQVDGKFSHFVNVETDNAWMGFSAGWNTRTDAICAEVKPLVWKADHGNEWRIFYADTCMGRYTYGTDNKGQAYWQDNHPNCGGYDVASEGVACECAERQYKRDLLATPYLNAIITRPASEVHQEGYDAGKAAGRAEALEEVREAIELAHTFFTKTITKFNVGDSFLQNDDFQNWNESGVAILKARALINK